MHLLLPYGSTDDVSGRNIIDAATGKIVSVYQNLTNPMGADTYASDALCKTKVKVCAGVTITVSGEMTICGELSGGGGGRNYSGQTVGYHAKLILESGVKPEVSTQPDIYTGIIVASGGILRSPGFIVEDTSNNESKVVVQSGGTMYQPFVIRDFKGGTITGVIYSEMSKYGYSPFRQFTMMNVEAKVKVEYGGYVNGYANIWADESHNADIATLVGIESSTDPNFIQLKSGAYLISKYDKDTQIMKMDIYGGAKTNEFSVTVEKLDKTASSLDFIFPISWMFDITLNSGTYEMRDGNKFKLLPGAKLTVAQGATLSIEYLSIYESLTDHTSTQPYPSAYPSSSSLSGNSLPAAKLTVNGTLIVDTLGGKVYTEVGDAKVHINTNTSIENNEPDEYGYKNLYISKRNTFTTTAELIYQYYEGNEIKFNQFSDSVKKECDYLSDSSTKTWVQQGTGSEGGSDSPDTCITGETMITLADGSQVMIKDLKGDEQILVWNHYTGKADVASILVLFNNNGQKIEQDVLRLEFSDGTYIEIIGEHVLFDTTLNKYVGVNATNVEEFIGHSFAKISASNDALIDVELIGYSVEHRVTDVYDINAEYHHVAFANGLLSCSAYSDISLNCYEFFGDNLGYSEEQNAEDIEKYGFYTYEDFEGILSREMFEAFHFYRLKICVAKGYTTWEEIVKVCNAWSSVS